MDTEVRVYLFGVICKETEVSLHCAIPLIHLSHREGSHREGYHREGSHREGSQRERPHREGSQR